MSFFDVSTSRLRAGAIGRVSIPIMGFTCIAPGRVTGYRPAPCNSYEYIRSRFCALQRTVWRGGHGPIRCPDFEGSACREIARRGWPGWGSLSMALRPHPLFGRMQGW